jgi:hypothetical protein
MTARQLLTGCALACACFLSACTGGSPTAPTANAAAAPSIFQAATAADTVTTTIGGTVRDRQNGAPIAGVTVAIVDPQADARVTGATDSNGIYRLSGITSTRFTVQFAHESYLTYSFEYSFRLGTERLDLTTQLAPGAIIPGEPAFTFDPEVSIADQELIREGIRLAQTYLPPAVGRGVVASTMIAVTVLPSTRPGTTAMANGHRIDVFVNSQGWQNATRVQKLKISWPGFYNSEGARWLMEGAAEYVGYRAVIDAGLVSYDTVRNCQVSNVSSGTPLPPLSTLEGQAFNETPGATYGLAWLAVEKSTQRNLGTLALYWSPSDSWRSAFRSAFGVDLDAFYTSFETERRDYRPRSSACSF